MESLIEGLLAPLLYPLDPAKRIYWGCILSSLFLASIVVTIQKQHFDIRKQLRSLFDRDYWFNKSAAQDVSWMFINSILRVTLLIPIIGSHLWFTLTTGRFLQKTLGDAPEVSLPWFVIASIYALVFLIFEDLSRFGLHFIMHRNPLLWRFHQIHHSATTLTPLTLFRVHPVESVAYFFRGIVIFGLVSGTFIWLFGRQLSTFDILGVNLLGFLFNFLGANLRHSHIWLSFGRAETLFISPAQHQIHHSRTNGHANLGTYLAIWDKLLKTWKPSGVTPVRDFGIQNPDRSSVPISAH
jgi:sterol desaturase/sphingolipid hydroxylase (fatty acid hydroxylase superfamily)